MTSELGSDDRLQACDQVRGLADGGILLGDVLPDQIADNDHARANGNAGLQRHVSGCFQGCDGFQDGEAGKDRPLRIVLVCRRIAEICKYPVAEILRDHAAKRFYFVGATGVERRDDIALFLRVEARRKCARRSGLDA